MAPLHQVWPETHHNTSQAGLNCKVKNGKRIQSNPQNSFTHSSPNPFHVFVPILIKFVNTTDDPSSKVEKKKRKGNARSVPSICPFRNPCTQFAPNIHLNECGKYAPFRLDKPVLVQHCRKKERKNDLKEVESEKPNWVALSIHERESFG